MNLNSRGFNCLNTHHLEFRFIISNTFTIPYIQNVSFLGSPDTTISDVLSLHKHLLIISTYVVGQFLVRTLNKRLKFIFTHLVKEPNNDLISFLSALVYTFNQRTQIKIDGISI